MYEKQWVGSAIPDVDRFMLFHIEVEDLMSRGKIEEARKLFRDVVASHGQHGYDPSEVLDLIFVSGEQLGKERAALNTALGESNA